MHMYICLHAYKYIEYRGYYDVFMMYYLSNVLMFYVFYNWRLEGLLFICKEKLLSIECRLVFVAFITLCTVDF